MMFRSSRDRKGERVGEAAGDTRRTILQRWHSWMEAERVLGLSTARLVLTVSVVAVCAYVVVYPFLLVRYPPMTDLPMHASMTSIVRHYFDSDYHFREQFTLHPIEAPYVTTYLLGAVLSFAMPITWAMKLVAIVMLSLLPAGLAVLFHGMKKNPIWGLLGLGLAWTNLTHWGWLNFVGALGLYAAAVGCTLLLVDQPTRKRTLALTACLVAVFFTHLYRLPFAVLAVVGTTVIMWPITRRAKPVAVPVGVAVVLFAIWWWVRPPALHADLNALGVHWSRLAELTLSRIFAGYSGPEGVRELALARQMLVGFALLALFATGWAFLRQRRHSEDPRRAWRRRVALVALGLSIAHVCAFVVLPMRMGEWWHVYPRELVVAALFALALMPDFPKRWWASMMVLAIIGLVTGRMTYFVAKQWDSFNAPTRGFAALAQRIPPAPKLYYLVMDESGSNKKDSPFIHLPAWVQAERGGWLQFHFAGWGLYPIRYRAGSDSVPPPFERGWEWNHVLFHASKGWFDWYLVRSRVRPRSPLLNDPAIEFVADSDGWYLYRRNPAVPSH